MPDWLWEIYGPWDLDEGEGIDLPESAAAVLDWELGSRWELTAMEAGAVLSCLVGRRGGVA